MTRFLRHRDEVRAKEDPLHSGDTEQTPGKRRAIGFLQARKLDRARGHDGNAGDELECCRIRSVFRLDKH